MSASARELDLLGARAWPTLEEIRLGGWRLRFAGGVTKRASSVLPLGPEDGTTLDRAVLLARLDAVERAYAGRRLPARFQITASSWPGDLPDVLSRRGYVESDPTLVMATHLRDAEEVRVSPGWTIVHRPEPSRAWLDAWWAVDGRGGAEEASIAGRILARIVPERTFLECADAAGVAGVGLGVLDGGWVGVQCMATLPRARRRGVASAVLREIARWAGDHGAEGAYLAVDEANAPAQRLYRGFGFSVLQRYVYLTRYGV